MNKEDIKKEFYDKFSDLRKLLNSWNLIPGAPKDEFDKLNHQILSHLYLGADFNRVGSILKGELSVYYGLYEDEFDVEEMANEVIEWWNSTDKRLA